MALPSDFNEIEQLQALVRRYLNKEVRQHFSDLGDEYWEPEIITTRGAMRNALTHKDNDPITATLVRMMLYYFTYGRAAAMQPSIVGMPKVEFDEHISVTYKPEVVLFFRQDLDAVPKGYTPTTARHSFRLMDETTETITKANVETLAKKIKSELALSKGFTFDKGKYLCLYDDNKNGYQLQIRAISEEEGERVVKKILSIRNHTFDGDNFRVSKPRRNSVNVPTIRQILGKPYKKSRWRPTAKVRFMYADLVISGLPNPIALVDRSGLKKNPLEFVY